MTGRPKFGQVFNRRFTDLAVVMGPSVRWVQDDTEDLLRWMPEVLLGYRVRMMTPNDRIRGLRVKKLIILDGPYTPEQKRQLMDAAFMVEFWEIGKIEIWHVHRGEGIWRIE